MPRLLEAIWEFIIQDSNVLFSNNVGQVNPFILKGSVALTNGKLHRDLEALTVTL